MLAAFAQAMIGPAVFIGGWAIYGITGWLLGKIDPEGRWDA